MTTPITDEVLRGLHLAEKERDDMVEQLKAAKDTVRREAIEAAITRLHGTGCNIVEYRQVAAGVEEGMRVLAVAVLGDASRP